MCWQLGRATFSRRAARAICTQALTSSTPLHRLNTDIPSSPARGEKWSYWQSLTNRSPPRHSVDPVRTFPSSFSFSLPLFGQSYSGSTWSCMAHYINLIQRTWWLAHRLKRDGTVPIFNVRSAFKNKWNQTTTKSWIQGLCGKILLLVYSHGCHTAWLKMTALVFHKNNTFSRLFFEWQKYKNGHLVRFV